MIHDLVEWDYGDYEGRHTVDIHRERPDWQLFRDGCPGGESPQHVAARADRVVKLVRSVAGNVLLFSSAHLLRMFGRALDRDGHMRRQVFDGEPSEPEHPWLRPYFGAGHSTME